MDAAWLQQRIALEPGYVFGILSAHAEALLKSLDASKTLQGPGREPADADPAHR